MGNYLFDADVLLKVLEQDAKTPGSHDFGRDIIPRLIPSHKIFAYNFLHNEIPGVRPYEELGYWRDVGTLDAYWQAHMDIVGESPILDLRNKQWPILTDSLDGPTASFVRSQLDDTMVGQGSQIIESTITRSVIGRNVRIDHGAVIEECVIGDGAIIGSKAHLRRVVADRFNVIPAGIEIGHERDADRQRFQRTKSGLVILPRGASAGDRALGTIE
jgi:glucose-1-phosphate adenylyltransferase